MGRLTIATSAFAFALVCARIGFAADSMMFSDRVPSFMPINSWTGFYVGLNAGGTWASNATSVTSNAVQGFSDGTGGASYAGQSAAQASGSLNAGRGGFIGGGQIGYNWQFSPAWVGGFETDIQGIANNNNDGILSSSANLIFLSANEVMNTQINGSAQLDYIGTIRGRFGYLWKPNILFYGTGGFAYGGVRASTSIYQSNNDCQQFPGNCIATSATTSGSVRETRLGWTAGAGLEWMFGQNWSAKVEYLYYDLGSATYSNGQLVFSTGSLGGIGPSVVDSRSMAEFNGQIVRFGVNYHF